MNTDRLTRLAKLLDEINATAPGRFDIGSWAHASQHACNTTACAVGWAGLDRSFQAEGFGLFVMDHDGKHHQTRTVDELNEWSLFGAFPAYQDTKHWEAVHLFFGIDARTANWLFAFDAYCESDDPSAGDVANRIRAVIANPNSIPESF